ncbi:MAG: NAD-dependent epimerase/dehydratase family protein [Anaerolineales bacterium]
MAELIDVQLDLLKSMGLLEKIRGRRVLVTGAGGFVGLHLSEALVGLGAEVHALSRNAESRGLPAGIKAHSVDLRSLNSVKYCLSHVKPEIVYHLAGLVNTRQHLNLVLPTLRNNLVGSVNLFLVLAEEFCDRLIVVGSSEEPAAGRLGAVANSPYAAAKEAETDYARLFNNIFSLPVVLARPFMSYGPRQPVEKIIPYVITGLLSGISPEISSGMRVCDLIYVQDLVMGLILSGFKSDLNGQAVDLGAGVGVTIRDAVSLVSEIMNASTKPKFGAIPDRLYELPQIANGEETFRLLGYRPHWSLMDGLKSTIHWYKSHPEFYGMGR